jgi:zinc protease
MTTEDARLDVVASLLAGRSRAFLSWELVGNKKVAAYVWAGQRSRNLASEFSVYIEAAPGKTATEVLAAFDSAMDALMAHPLEQLDVDHAVYDTIVDRAYSWEAAEARVGEYAKYQASVGSPAYLPHDLARYDGITPSVVSDALKRFLPRDRRVVVLVSPSPKAAPGGERLSRRTVPARQP